MAERIRPATAMVDCYVLAGRWPTAMMHAGQHFVMKNGACCRLAGAGVILQR